MAPILDLSESILHLLGKIIFLKLKLDHAFSAQNPPTDWHYTQKKNWNAFPWQWITIWASTCLTWPVVPLLPFSSTYFTGLLVEPWIYHVCSRLWTFAFAFLSSWDVLLPEICMTGSLISFRFLSCVICLEKTSSTFPLKRACRQQSLSTYSVIDFFIAPIKILFVIYAFAYLFICMCVLFPSIEYKFPLLATKKFPRT